MSDEPDQEFDFDAAMDGADEHIAVPIRTLVFSEASKDGAYTKVIFLEDLLSMLRHMKERDDDDDPLDYLLRMTELLLDDPPDPDRVIAIGGLF